MEQKTNPQQNETKQFVTSEEETLNEIAQRFSTIRVVGERYNEPTCRNGDEKRKWRDMNEQDFKEYKTYSEYRKRYPNIVAQAALFEPEGMEKKFRVIEKFESFWREVASSDEEKFIHKQYYHKIIDLKREEKDRENLLTNLDEKSKKLYLQFQDLKNDLKKIHFDKEQVSYDTGRDLSKNYYEMNDTDFPAVKSYVCENHIERYGYGSKNWKIETSLPDYIAFRIRVDNGNMNGIKIYVIHCNNEVFDVYLPEYMIEKLQNNNTDTQRKSIKLKSPFLHRVLLFTQISPKDNKERAFFILMAKEFERCDDKDTLKRNEGRVYISFIDSTEHYIKSPSQHNPFATILNAYLEYVSAIGFARAHIWSCSPNEKEHYLFNCEKKSKLQAKLDMWYNFVFSKGSNNRFAKWRYEHKTIPIHGKDLDLPIFPNDCTRYQFKPENNKVLHYSIFIVHLNNECIYYNRYFEKIQLFKYHKQDTVAVAMYRLNFRQENAVESTAKLLKREPTEIPFHVNSDFCLIIPKETQLQNSMQRIETQLKSISKEYREFCEKQTKTNSHT